MPYELVALGIMGLSLTLYALLGGADFGAGVWEFNSAFQTSDKERALLQRAVGPVWEANHVWLLFALVIAHTAFPLAFAAVSQALWLPLLLALGGIVFRGVGFVFRAYAVGAPRQQSVWGAVFALASTAAPFFFGAAVGALASGGLAIAPDGSYQGDFATGWVQPLGIFTAFFAVGVCAYLAAVYFAREAWIAGEDELLETWRRRALASGAAMGILAAVGLLFLSLEAPRLWARLAPGASPGGVLVVASAGAGLGSLIFLWRRAFTWATVAAASAVVAVMLGWMLAQYPYLVPPAITVEAAMGPPGTTRTAVFTALAGGVLLVPALGFLFYLFKSAPRADD